MIEIVLYQFWIFSHFGAPQGLFWPLKGLYLKSRAKNLWDNTIITYRQYNTNHRFLALLLCDLAFLATSVAFLAFMTLKRQNTESSSFLTPNDHRNVIISIFFRFLTLWPLKWPLRPLLAFFNILWASWCLLRPLVPENVKSLQKQCF